MTIQDLKSLIPMVILAAGVLLVMILIALKRSHAIAFITTLVVISAAIIAVIFRFDENPHAIGDIFIIDRFGLYYQAAVCNLYHFHFQLHQPGAVLSRQTKGRVLPIIDAGDLRFVYDGDQHALYFLLC
jgi:NADH:ubiquinone oxidoreductase subunit 2 (subunit N)